MDALDEVRPVPADPVEPRAEAVARGAVGWSVLNTLVSKAGATFVGIVLARILVPEDYGTYAVALVGLNALLSVNELGVSLAIVRWPREVSRIAPTVVTLAFASSLILCAGVMLAAPSIAGLLNTPEAANLLRVLALGVLIDAVTAVPSALMTRTFMQKQRMYVDLAGFALTSGISIGLAVAGFGAWGLVLGGLAGNILNGVLIVRQAPQWYNPGFDRQVAGELLRFGAPLALASALVFALLNVDYVVVGSNTDTAQLGFYLLAFNLSTWPVNVFSAPARRVSLPAFAQLHARKTAPSDAFVPACTALLTVTLPACVLIAVFAVPLVSLVYGDKWTAAAHVLPWLMGLALVRVFGELAYDFLVALDRPDSTLVVQGLWLLVTIPALIVGVRWDGIVGVAIAHTAVSLGVVVPAYALVLRRAGVRMGLLVRDIARPLVGVALTAAVAVAVLLLVPDELAAILLGGVLAGLTYVAVVWPMRHRFMAAGASAEVAA